MSQSLTSILLLYILPPALVLSLGIRSLQLGKPASSLVAAFALCLLATINGYADLAGVFSVGYWAALVLPISVFGLSMLARCQLIMNKKFLVCDVASLATATLVFLVVK